MNDRIARVIPSAGDLVARMEYARALAAASLVPKAYQQNPANILVAVEYGEALGLGAMAAMSEINVINGTPSLSASLMASLARSAGHRVRTYEEAGRAVCQIVRYDDPEFIHETVWDEEKARQAGLWGKGHWVKDPVLMMKWRAISECVRLACPEVLAGIKYTPEEVRDFVATQPTQTASVPRSAPANEPRIAPANPLRIAKFGVAVCAPNESYSLEPPYPVVDAEIVAEHRPATARQRAELGALIKDLAVEKVELEALMSGWLARECADGTKDLAEDEAAQVISELRAMVAAANADPVTGETV